MLDLLLDRAPYSADAGTLFSEAERGHVSGMICSTAVTTIHYLARKAIGAKAARMAIGNLLAILEPAPVNRPVLDAALASDFKDFEDAVAHESGRLAGVEALVTRNVRDFRGASVPVYSPSELVQILAGEDRI